MKMKPTCQTYWPFIIVNQEYRPCWLLRLNDQFFTNQETKASHRCINKFFVGLSQLHCLALFNFLLLPYSFKKNKYGSVSTVNKVKRGEEFALLHIL